MNVIHLIKIYLNFGLRLTFTNILNSLIDYHKILFFITLCYNKSYILVNIHDLWIDINLISNFNKWILDKECQEYLNIPKLSKYLNQILAITKNKNVLIL